MVEPAFFDIPTYPPALARLYQTIGTGCFGKTDDIAFKLSVTPDAEPDEEAQRELWKIELSLDGQTVLAWVDEAMLLEWLEPVLPVPELSSLAVDLYQAALTYVLTPWFDWCVSHQLAPPSVKALSGPVSAPSSLGLTLSLVEKEQGHWLNLHLEHFPLSWLTEFAQTLTIQARPPEREVIVHASAGLARLSVSALSALAVGDVVMASRQAPLAEGGLLLTIDQMLVQVQQLDDNQFKVENIMYQSDDEMNSPSDAHDSSLESAVEALPITLVFEIGRMSVPLSALSQLTLGDVLEADFKTTPEINVRAQGQLIATATLVQIGERLGAKITHMIQSETTHDAA